MAPEELTAVNGPIDIELRNRKPSIDRLRQLAAAFRHTVWLNPLSASLWDYSETVVIVRQLFPMFPLDLAGLEKAVTHLRTR